MKEELKKEDNYTNIILEEMRSNFKIFGEVLGGFGEKLDVVRKKGDATFEEVGKIRLELNEVNVRLDGIDGRLDNIEIEVKSLRKDFDLIKSSLKEKDIKQFEERLIRIEKHLEL